MATRLSDDERRLGVRTPPKAPGDLRDFPGDDYRPLTHLEKKYRAPNAGGRARAELGVDVTDDPNMKKAADVLIAQRNRRLAKI